MLQTLFDGIKNNNPKRLKTFKIGLFKKGIDNIYFTSNNKSDDKLTEKDLTLLHEFLNKNMDDDDSGKSYYDILNGKFTDNLKINFESGRSEGKKLKEILDYIIFKGFLESESVKKIGDSEKIITELKLLWMIKT